MFAFRLDRPLRALCARTLGGFIKLVFKIGLALLLFVSLPALIVFLLLLKLLLSLVLLQ